MRYTLKHKLISIGGDSMIQDEHGKDVYFVDGAAISVGRRLSIKDMHGKDLADIYQEVIALVPTFHINIKGGTSATISMKILTITDRLKIDVPGWNDLEARGNLFHHDYGIYRGSDEVAHISKAWVALTDSYGIQIDNDEDVLLMLSCAVVIDEILEMRERGDKE